ncbi:MAG: peptidase M50 [Oscillibacter sp.]|nr:peptidase M50 [Oscillibacter sp.]
MSFIYILAAVFIFGFLVAIHELGHFLAARLCGVRVNEFSIGMGPLLWHRETEETQYSIRLLPLGGFCALEGEDGDQEDPRSFSRQGFWKKFVIMAAGSFMNLLAGVAIIACLYVGASGFYVDQVAGFSEGFPLEGEDGLMEGDVFYKIDGWRTYLRGDAMMFLRFYDGESIDLEVIRDGKRVMLEDLPLTRGTYDGQPGRFGLLVGAELVPADFWTTLRFVGYQTLDFIQQVWFSLVQLIKGNVEIKDFSGPVGIVTTITEVGSAAKTWIAAVRNIAFFAALLAVNLAVMNLLPIPALDGGRIFFLLVDAAAMRVFKRKVPEKYQAAVNMACFALLMGMMLLVTFYDVSKLLA